MKNKILLLVALCGLTLSCCSTLGKGLQDQAAAVQAILDANFPATFTGPAELHFKGSYTSLDMVAEGLRKDPATEKWTWTYMKADTFGHFPVFYGVNLSNEIHIIEGTLSNAPTAAPAPSPSAVLGTTVTTAPTVITQPATTTTTVTTAVKTP